MPKGARSQHSCALVKNLASGGNEIVVAGGYGTVPVDTVEIFNLETSSWRDGKTTGSSNICFVLLCTH
jgi:hypothetical protein